MAILSHKIISMNVGDEIISRRAIIRRLVEEHLKLIRLGKTIEDAFNLVFLFEFFIDTLLIGLISYLTMLNFDDADAMAFISTAIYVIAVVLIAYGNSVMGQYPQDESEKLHSVYYHCNWYRMPSVYRKALVLCMTQAQMPIELTAGKFYIYSLNSFTSIMKSSGAYISMLHTLI
ncbi:hypothetical protein PV328_002266 [Microctonus aethiopoides]|uniref:Uncharacterized protein n=1 Tax=Microctonus aethiopoides TaxID=144406 RepID=A0AA39FZ16_9HYME|nr:hypothetical protein PV328_002266 [Microctonus aethiopoides]